MQEFFENYLYNLLTNSFFTSKNAILKDIGYCILYHIQENEKIYQILGHHIQAHYVDLHIKSNGLFVNLFS